ncbi:hypothetical protein TRVL_08438 [Trypanosoma vivax]|nr:hypothetical protein TRVL_08438 [Trypanosoma vivax]
MPAGFGAMIDLKFGPRRPNKDNGNTLSLKILHLISICSAFLLKRFRDPFEARFVRLKADVRWLTVLLALEWALMSSDKNGMARNTSESDRKLPTRKCRTSRCFIILIKPKSKFPPALKQCVGLPLWSVLATANPCHLNVRTPREAKMHEWLSLVAM